MNESKEKPTEKNCKTCVFCKQVYGQFGYRVSTLERFLCAVTDGFTELTNTCNQWQKKLDEKPDLSSARFDKAEEDIKAIKDIMKKYNLSLNKKARR